MQGRGESNAKEMLKEGCKDEKKGGLGQGNLLLEEGKQNNQTDRREKVITTVTEGKRIKRKCKRKAGKVFNSTHRGAAKRRRRVMCR